MEEFHRIRRLPPYVFEEINRAKAVARNAGADIIDLGMGNPDLPAPAHVIEKLKETVGKPRTDRYSSSRGIAGLRRAQAAYYARRFGVKLNPETQVVATLGSKEGFANVAQAITAPGDVILVPNPSYPIHAFGFLMAGGVISSVQTAGFGLTKVGGGTLKFSGSTANTYTGTTTVQEGLLLSVQPYGLCGGPRFLSRADSVCEETRCVRAFRSRLCGSVFRRCPSAIGAAGAWRNGHCGRVHVHVQDLFHARLADRLCGGE